MKAYSVSFALGVSETAGRPDHKGTRGTRRRCSVPQIREQACAAASAVRVCGANRKPFSESENRTRARTDVAAEQQGRTHAAACPYGAPRTRIVLGAQFTVLLLSHAIVSSRHVLVSDPRTAKCRAGWVSSSPARPQSERYRLSFAAGGPQHSHENLKHRSNRILSSWRIFITGNFARRRTRGA